MSSRPDSARGGGHVSPERSIKVRKPRPAPPPKTSPEPPSLSTAERATLHLEKHPLPPPSNAKEQEPLPQRVTRKVSPGPPKLSTTSRASKRSEWEEETKDRKKQEKAANGSASLEHSQSHDLTHRPSFRHGGGTFVKPQLEQPLLPSQRNPDLTISANHSLSGSTLMKGSPRFSTPGSTLMTPTATAINRNTNSTERPKPQRQPSVEVRDREQHRFRTPRMGHSPSAAASGSRSTSPTIRGPSFSRGRESQRGRSAAKKSEKPAKVDLLDDNEVPTAEDAASPFSLTTPSDGEPIAAFAKWHRGEAFVMAGEADRVTLRDVLSGEAVCTLYKRSSDRSRTSGHGLVTPTLCTALTTAEAQGGTSARLMWTGWSDGAVILLKEMDNGRFKTVYQNCPPDEQEEAAAGEEGEPQSSGGVHNVSINSTDTAIGRGSSVTAIHRIGPTHVLALFRGCAACSVYHILIDGPTVAIKHELIPIPSSGLLGDDEEAEEEQDYDQLPAPPPHGADDEVIVSGTVVAATAAASSNEEAAEGSKEEGAKVDAKDILPPVAVLGTTAGRLLIISTHEGQPSTVKLQPAFFSTVPEANSAEEGEDLLEAVDGKEGGSISAVAYNYHDRRLWVGTSAGAVACLSRELVADDEESSEKSTRFEVKGRWNVHRSPVVSLVPCGSEFWSIDESAVVTRWVQNSKSLREQTGREYRALQAELSSEQDPRASPMRGVRSAASVARARGVSEVVPTASLKGEVLWVSSGPGAAVHPWFVPNGDSATSNTSAAAASVELAALRATMESDARLAALETEETHRTMLRLRADLAAERAAHDSVMSQLEEARSELAAMKTPATAQREEQSEQGARTPLSPPAFEDVVGESATAEDDGEADEEPKGDDDAEEGEEEAVRDENGEEVGDDWQAEEGEEAHEEEPTEEEMDEQTALLHEMIEEQRGVIGRLEAELRQRDVREEAQQKVSGLLQTQLSALQKEMAEFRCVKRVFHHSVVENAEFEALEKKLVDQEAAAKIMRSELTSARRAAERSNHIAVALQDTNSSLTAERDRARASEKESAFVIGEMTTELEYARISVKDIQKEKTKLEAELALRAQEKKQLEDRLKRAHEFAAAAPQPEAAGSGAPSEASTSRPSTPSASGANKREGLAAIEKLLEQQHSAEKRRLNAEVERLAAELEVSRSRQAEAERSVEELRDSNDKTVVAAEAPSSTSPQAAIRRSESIELGSGAEEDLPEPAPLEVEHDVSHEAADSDEDHSDSEHGDGSRPQEHRRFEAILIDDALRRVAAAEVQEHLLTETTERAKLESRELTFRLGLHQLSSVLRIQAVEQRSATAPSPQLKARDDLLRTITSILDDHNRKRDRSSASEVLTILTSIIREKSGSKMSSPSGKSNSRERSAGRSVSVVAPIAAPSNKRSPPGNAAASGAFEYDGGRYNNHSSQ